MYPPLYKLHIAGCGNVWDPPDSLRWSHGEYGHKYQRDINPEKYRVSEIQVSEAVAGINVRLGDYISERVKLIDCISERVRLRDG